MGDRLVFVVWAVAAFGAPLAWRLWRDRVARRALAVHANIEAALRRALGGESLVSVKVTASIPGRRGRVVLSVPRGWDWLVRTAWERIVEALPADHDLVIRGAGRAPSGTPYLGRRIWDALPGTLSRPPALPLSRPRKGRRKKEEVA
jgi:hypothetical protein